jgi:hypothetical protein
MAILIPMLVQSQVTVNLLSTCCALENQLNQGKVLMTACVVRRPFSEKNQYFTVPVNGILANQFGTPWADEGLSYLCVYVSLIGSGRQPFSFR